jgi:hypothetical protein
MVKKIERRQPYVPLGRARGISNIKDEQLLELRKCVMNSETDIGSRLPMTSVRENNGRLSPPQRY